MSTLEHTKKVFLDSVEKFRTLLGEFEKQQPISEDEKAMYAAWKQATAKDVADMYAYCRGIQHPIFDEVVEKLECLYTDMAELDKKIIGL